MKRSERERWIRYTIYAVFLLSAGLLAALSWRSLNYNWRWGLLFSDWAHLLVQGLGLTLGIASVGLLLALPLGILIGLCRTALDPGARLLGFLYVELIRGTPLLVQVFLWYFVLVVPIYACRDWILHDVLGFVGTFERWESFTAGVCALSCFTASYIAEIVRAGIQSIDPGQMEAARSLGLSRMQALRHVILPQAVRRILPPLASEFIALVKDSSLASVIGLEELTKQARDVQGRAFLTFEVWILAACLYLVINVLLSFGVRLLEKRLGQGVRREQIR